MNLILGGDHRGHSTLIELDALLGAAGHQLHHCCTEEGRPIDYPDKALAVAHGHPHRGPNPR